MSQLTADLLLLLVTVAWGSTFVIVKDAISQMGPLTFLAVRFFIAGAVLLVWYWVQTSMAARRVRVGAAGSVHSVAPDNAAGSSVIVTQRFIATSILTGIALFISYATQTLGLVTVSAGKTAFITGLYVVLVPIASRVVLRTVPDLPSIIGVALATIGLGLLSLKLPLEIATGDILVLACAVSFTWHILLIDRYSGTGPSVLYTAIQLLVVSIGSAIAAIVTERPLYVAPGAWGAILFTAIIASAFAFLAQTECQRYTTATHAALIFVAEPVFGAVFAYFLAHEILSPREIVGAACMMAGVLVAELPTFWRRRPREERELEPGQAESGQ